MKIETLIGSIGGDLKDELVEELLHRSRRKVDSALKRIRRPEAAVGVVKSPLGDLLVATSARGIALAHYLHDDSDLTVTIAKLRSDFDPVEDQHAVAEVGNEVRRYLAGDLEALRQNITSGLDNVEITIMHLLARSHSCVDYKEKRHGRRSL